MIVIVDYNMGNLHSVKRKLEKNNVNVMISSLPSDILNAEKLILPGVGHFGKAMNNLKELNLIDALNQAVLINKTPILGICLGMQLMTKHSEEGNMNGLGWFDATVVKFNIKDKLRFKVPHIGWNSIQIQKNDPLLSNLADLSELYFVHSYFVKSNARCDVLTTTNYEQDFVSGMSKENIFGLQFHPEKSHDIGLSILQNFCGIK